MDPFRGLERSERDARRQADQALWREQMLFLEGPVTVFRWIATEGWPVEYVSPNVRQFGYAAEDFTSGRIPYATVVHPLDLERVAAEVAAHSAAGTSSFEQDYRLVGPDGAIRYIYDRTLVVRDAAGVITHYDGYILDVTERRHAEEERRRFETQLKEAQKLESLGVLAGGIAHDFNNLLMGILGHASLALADLPLDGPPRESLQQIELAARRAAELTNQMLAYSGRGRFQVEPVNLSQLVNEITQLLEAVISKKASLQFDLAGDLPPVEADATQLRQVVMNLMTNASDALRHRPGQIRVATGVTRAAEVNLPQALAHEPLPEGDCVFLEVADDGSGMDVETRQRIFEPFFTTKTKGRGLGLAGVLGIVRGHKGAIFVESAPGRGTTFRLLFPVARSSATTRPPRLAVAPVSWRRGGAVLVIDDEVTVRDVARRMLVRLGFKPLLAADGADGLALFRRESARLVAVLLDLTMPEKGGDEILSEIQRTRPELPVILSSGYDEEDTRPRVASLSRFHFLQKPYSLADLQARLREALDAEAAGEAAG